MPKIIPAQIVDVGRFKALYFNSVPPRLEAAVAFDGQDLSQKLIFQMMDISWRHGFGCSAPEFEENGDLIFSIGTILPSSRSLGRFSKKLSKCLEEVADFSVDFARQLDFSTLDVSMFSGFDISDLDLSLISAVRDQQHSGNWENFLKALRESGRDEEASVVDMCREFEKVNKRDIALVGNKLLETLLVVGDSTPDKN